MAQNDIETNFGVVDKRAVSKAGTNAMQLTANEYASISVLRTRLAAINGTYYTAARLDQMTKNDMIFAVRQSDDLAGI